MCYDPRRPASVSIGAGGYTGAVFRPGAAGGCIYWVYDNVTVRLSKAEGERL